MCVSVKERGINTCQLSLVDGVGHTHTIWLHITDLVCYRRVDTCSNVLPNLAIERVI